jgi:hypothetical protein
MRGRSLLDPGPLRGWWWRSSQVHRLAVVSAGTAVAVVLLASGLLGAPRWTTRPQGGAYLPLTTLSTAIATNTGTTVSGSGDPTGGGSATATDGPPKVSTTGTSSVAPATQPASATTTSAAAESTTAGPSTTTTNAATTTIDVQRGVRVGEPCSPEGATGITVQGQTVTCVADPRGKAKWRKQ